MAWCAMVDGRYGPMMFNINDAYVGKAFATYGEYSEEEVRFVREMVRGKEVVLDIGANVGALTIPMAQVAGLVFAFEPQRDLFNLLSGNVALNSLENVECIRVAVGKECGTIGVPRLDPNMKLNFGALDLRKGHSGIQTPLVTIDSLGLDACDFIKIDVEGMEPDVLEGGEETIRRFGPDIYVEADREDVKDKLFSTLRSFGYELWWHRALFYNPDNVAGITRDVFVEEVDPDAKMVSFNVLASHGTIGSECGFEAVG